MYVCMYVYNIHDFIRYLTVTTYNKYKKYIQMYVYECIHVYFVKLNTRSSILC